MIDLPALQQQALHTLQAHIEEHTIRVKRAVFLHYANVLARWDSQWFWEDMAKMRDDKSQGD